MPQVFDTIVVGAGAAGYVLSSRLSERPSHQVLLLAAGVDTPPGAERDDIADIYPTLYYNIHYIWPGLKAHWRTGHETPFSQARGWAAVDRLWAWWRCAMWWPIARD